MYDYTETIYSQKVQTSCLVMLTWSVFIERGSHFLHNYIQITVKECESLYVILKSWIKLIDCRSKVNTIYILGIF